MQTNEYQIKAMERSDFRPWTLDIPCWILDIPELFYAAVAAGFAPGKPLFSVFSAIDAIQPHPLLYPLRLKASQN
jgi:hypothetical protein